MAHFVEAKEKDPFGLATWNNIAVALMLQGNWLDALYELEGAYNLSSAHPLVSNNIAYCLCNLNDEVAAEYWAQQALSLNPGLARPYLSLGELALRAGRLSEARQHAERALRRDTGDDSVRSLLIRVYQAQGETVRVDQEASRFKSLAAKVPLGDCLIDEDESTPWGQIYLERDNDGPGEDGGDSAVPRKPNPSPPTRAAARSLDEESKL